jgi:hypothetical protein
MPKSIARCPWGDGSPRYAAYHDLEWGVPVHDERLFFEFLILEGAQAGLSWSTILNKRDRYREAFAGFDPARVARFDARRIDKLLQDPGIVRNRLKVESSVGNARAFLALQLRPLRLGVRRRPADPKPMAVVVAGAGQHARIRRVVARSQAPRLSFRRHDDHVRVHAGDRTRERPSGCVPALEGGAGNSVMNVASETLWRRSLWGCAQALEWPSFPSP